jgi:hypothetical protein
VKEQMMAICHQLQVFQPIVEFVPVDVMKVHTFRDGAVRSLPNSVMLKLAPPVQRDTPVAIGVDVVAGSGSAHALDCMGTGFR